MGMHMVMASNAAQLSDETLTSFTPTAMRAYLSYTIGAACQSTIQDR